MVHLPAHIYGLFFRNKKYFPPKNNFAPPSHRLVTPAGCCISSRCPLVVPPTCQLVAPGLIVSLSRCLVVSSSRRLVVSSSRRLVVSSSRRLVVSSSRRLVVSSSRRLVVSSSRRLVILSCHLLLSRRASWLLHHYLSSSSHCHCTAPSSSHRAGWLVHCLSLCRPIFLSLQSIADAIKRRRTLLPPLNTTAIIAIERRLYRPPLLPQLPSIAITTAKHQRPLIVASAMPICSPHRRCCRTLPLPLTIECHLHCPSPLNAVFVIHCCHYHRHYCYRRHWHC